MTKVITKSDFTNRVELKKISYTITEIIDSIMYHIFSIIYMNFEHAHDIKTVNGGYIYTTPSFIFHFAIVEDEAGNRQVDLWLLELRNRKDEHLLKKMNKIGDINIGRIAWANECPNCSGRTTPNGTCVECGYNYKST